MVSKKLIPVKKKRNENSIKYLSLVNEINLYG